MVLLKNILCANWSIMKCIDISNAISREKQMKIWKRQWKVELIEKMNRDWEDLYETLNPI